MGRTPWWTYLWPGLPQLWRQAGWGSLAVAAGFAALVNLALASSLVWSELLTPGPRIGVWAAVAVVWTGSAFVSYWQQCRRPVEQAHGTAEGAFALALDHYLKGNWFEAEHVLRELLGRDPGDVDAGLTLATLFRHTGRHDEALRQLDAIERLEASGKWELEISRERELLAEVGAEDAQASGQSASAGADDPAAKISDAA